MNTIFRRPTEDDRETLITWIAEDPDHRDKVTPDFFISEGGVPMVIGDLQGPGLYVRMDSEQPASVRLHIQFSKNFIRSARTMLRAWPTFKAKVESTGIIKRMVFESTSKSLIEFCKECFGFRRCGNTSNDYELILGGE